jgi:hypothetical protein
VSLCGGARSRQLLISACQLTSDISSSIKTYQQIALDKAPSSAALLAVIENLETGEKYGLVHFTRI